MTRVFFNIEQGEYRSKGIVFNNAILNLYMKTLSCRDAGCECDYIAKGETEEEVIRDAAQHGIKEHGKTQEDMTQMQSNLRAAIRGSWQIKPGIMVIIWFARVTQVATELAIREVK